MFVSKRTICSSLAAIFFIACQEQALAQQNPIGVKANTIGEIQTVNTSSSSSVIGDLSNITNVSVSEGPSRFGEISIDPSFRAKMLGRDLTRLLHDELQVIYEEYDFTPGGQVTTGLVSGGKEITFTDVVGPPGTTPLDGFLTHTAPDQGGQLGLRSLDYGSIRINGEVPVSPQTMSITSCDPVSISGDATILLVGEATSIIKLKRNDLVVASTQQTFSTIGQFPHRFEFNQPLDSGGYTLTQHVVPFKKTSWEGDGSSFWFPLSNSSSCTKNVAYQAHVKRQGWRDWVSNGISSGTTGEGKRIEAVKIKLEGDANPNMRICYRAHVKRNDWTSEVCDGATAGTTGENRRMEGVKIRLLNAPAGCSVQYRAHVKGDGWQSWVSNNQLAGTTSKRMEDLQIRLTEECGP